MINKSLDEFKDGGYENKSKHNKLNLYIFDDVADIGQKYPKGNDISKLHQLFNLMENKEQAFNFFQNVYYGPFVIIGTMKPISQN